MGVLSEQLGPVVERLVARPRIYADANLPAGIADALQSGQKIKAIKLYRLSSGVGLKEAKDFIEAVQRRSGLA